MTKILRMGALLLAGVLAAGCGGGSEPAGAGDDPAAGADKGPYLLAKEPAGAKGVKDVRKGAADGDEVVVLGRIGGSGSPFVAGRASFTLVDLSLEPCDDDGCGNPWCSADRNELKQAVTLVKFVDEQGKTLAQDAENVLGLKVLQTVVVRGRAKRDAGGNVTIVASGLHVRP